MQQEAGRKQAGLALQTSSILMLIFAVAAMCFCTVWYYFFVPKYMEVFADMGVYLPKVTVLLFDIPSSAFNVVPIAFGVILVALEIVISRKLVTFWIHLAVFLLSIVFWAFLVMACSLPTLSLLLQLQGD